MAGNCFRFFGITDWAVIDQLTLKQYRIMSEAFKLKQVDEEFIAYRQAWINREVKAEKKVGKGSKLVYDKFEKFYDYNSKIAEAGGKVVPLDQSDKAKSIRERFSQLQKMKKGGKNGRKL